MNSAHWKTAIVAFVAMIIGGIVMFIFAKTSKETVSWTSAPAEVQPAEKSAPQQFAEQFDVDLAAAIAAAKSARAAGALKPLATTPDEFARALGGINFRMTDFTARFDEPPAAAAPEFAAYSSELQQLTADLSNLLCDDSLFENADTETTKSLAHYEALMASGALDLDAVTTARVEALISIAYEKSLPTKAPTNEAELAEFDKAFDAITADLEPKIRALLTPEQLKRLEAIGLDQALFGLGDREDE